MLGTRPAFSAYKEAAGQKRIARLFMYGVRLARQERFVDVARALEHNAVSRDLVAVLQLQHVVQDDFVDVHLPDAAAAYRLYLGSGMMESLSTVRFARTS